MEDFIKISELGLDVLVQNEERFVLVDGSNDDLIVTILLDKKLVYIFSLNNNTLEQQSSYIDVEDLYEIITESLELFRNNDMYGLQNKHLESPNTFIQNMILDDGWKTDFKLDSNKLELLVQLQLYENNKDLSLVENDADIMHTISYIYTFGINVFDVELSPHLIIYLISISDSLTSVKFHVHIIIDQIKKNTNITQQIELSDALKYVEVYKLGAPSLEYITKFIK